MKNAWMVWMVLSALLLAQDGIKTQKPITFEKHFGNESYTDWAESVRQTKDGGYIVAANAGSCLDGCYDALIIRLAPNGDTLWKKRFGETEYDMAYSIQETKEGGFIMAGVTFSKGKSEPDGWVVKMDAAGNVLWDKTFGGKEGDFLYAIELTDNGYISIGYTGSKGKGQNDVWVIGLDDDGNMLWDKTFGGSENDGVQSMSRTKDKGYILVGATASKGEHNTGPWLLKLDDKGTLLWEANVDGWADDQMLSVLETDDGGYILAGSTMAKGAREKDGLVIRLDAHANILWDKTYGGSQTDVLYEVIKTQDGGYLLAGGTKSKGNGEMDAWVLKIDRDGNALSEKTFGQSRNDGVYSAVETEDGDYVLAGTTEGNYSYDIWIIKLDKDGMLSH